jgi:endonuclease YncB( thermonuclease family)
MGILTVKGTVDVNQFWPKGRSDADTSKILVTVDPASMVYRNRPGAKGKNVFKVYSGACTDKALKNPVIEKGLITVRLQGIDAPELHYRPQTEKSLGSLAKAKNNGVQVVFDYRQAQAETATNRLREHLEAKSNKPAIPCTFVTSLDDQMGPADAIDKYGRFVGDIFVGQENVSHWILQQGLALVSLYNSLQKDELDAYVKAWTAGKHKGIARHHSRALIGFDPDSQFRKPKQGVEAVSEGNAKFILPKLYRRQTTWFAYHKLGKFPKDLEAFLHTKDDSDRVLDVTDFLENGGSAIQRPFSTCLEDGKRLKPKPEQMVFIEGAGGLYARQGNQVKKLTSWP